MDDELIYLACPYSGTDEEKRQRFHAVNRAAGRLMNAGHVVFSPISHSHPIAVDANLPGDWEFWDRYDRAILKRCTRVIVLPLPGWEKSRGVQAEMAIAKELGLPVVYLDE